MSVAVLERPEEEALLPTPQPASPVKPPRDRYIDTLRLAALVRVLVFHTLGGVIMPMVFPSMGIMFALAGSLMAASIDRRTGTLWSLLGRRMRRLLVPFWGFALAMVSIMVWHAYEPGQSGEAITAQNGWLWVLPVGTPPAPQRAADWVVPLWYIVTYLWLVLVSPVLLWLFRRWPKVVLCLPVAFVALHTAGLLDLEGRIGTVIVNVLTYAGCWMLGFAHHDGLLRRIPWRVVLPLAAALIGAGLWWAFAFPTLEDGPSIDDIPLAACLHALGATLLVLRIPVKMQWLRRIPPLDWLVTAANRRALTIYLWGNFVIAMALRLRWNDSLPFVGARFSHRLAVIDGRLVSLLGSTGALMAWVFATVALACLAAGWLEDLAAGRRPQLVPWVGGHLRAWRERRRTRRTLTPVAEPA